MCIELFVIFSDDGLNFCGICGDFPFIILYCIYFVVVSFLFNQSGSWSVYFVDLFKKPALGFTDFLEGFSCLNLLQFSSDLSYFLSSAGFWYQDDVGLIKSFQKDSLFLDYLESFQKKWHQLLFVCLVEFGCERIWTWAFFGGRLLLAASTSDLVIGLFIVLASSWFRLGRTQVSRNLSISSRFTSLCA